MQPFVDEAVDLTSNGIIINDQQIPVSIKGFVCDAPAKAFILGVKNHNGYSSCTRCKQAGVWEHNKVLFPSLKVPPRTHEEFLNRADRDYQIGLSNLHLIPNIDFVTSFPLDYMHLICLGVTRTLMGIWIAASPPLKLPSRVLESISIALESFQSSIPVEFCRVPRGLKEVKRWKATEYRQFLLYTGPIILKHELKQTYPGYYENFLSLHIAMRILLSQKYCFDHLQSAKELLTFFVESVMYYYGRQYMTHNFHNLLHICDDVNKFGNLDNCSAFRFENFLGQLKKLVRSGKKPLHQICNRLAEQQNSEPFQEVQNSKSNHQPQFSTQHSDGPLMSSNEFKEQFKEMSFGSFTLKITFPNSCCLLDDGRVVIVYNIVRLKSNNEMCIVFKEYLTKEDFFAEPFIKSSKLNIFSIKNLARDFDICSVNCIKEKMILLNHANETVVLPLLHRDPAVKNKRRSKYQ